MCKNLLLEITKNHDKCGMMQWPDRITAKSLFKHFSVFFQEESPTKKSSIFENVGQLEARDQILMNILFLESISISKYPAHLRRPHFYLNSTHHR